MKKLVLGIFLLGILIMIATSVIAGEPYQRPCDTPEDICTWTTSGDPDYGLPLGSADTSTCGLHYSTLWSVNTNATATCVFNGDYLEDAMLYVSINNDIINCTLNGELVFGSIEHENCAPEDPRDEEEGFSTDIHSYVVSGENTLICEIQDRGVMTHFDACVVGEYDEPECELIVDKPEKNEFFDSEPVPIEWHLSGGCSPIDHFWLYSKQNGNCSDLDHGWDYLTDGSNAVFGDNPYSYLWDRPLESGQYCIKVKLTSNGARNSSEVFNVDLAPPYVNLSVGEPKVGDCDEEQTGDCYVNQATSITLTCSDDNPAEPWQSGVDYIEYQINNGNVVRVYDDSTTFKFTEDSEHTVTY